MSDPRMTTPADTLGTIAPMLAAIAHFPGRLLFSGMDTIRPGDLYIMGMNPGGAFTPNPPLGETIGFTLVEARDKWSYLEDSPETLAAEVLQERVKGVLQGLGRAPNTTLITNAVFVRAGDKDAFKADSLDFWKLWWNPCWPIHQVLLGVVRPKLVVCFGNEAYEALRAPCPPEGRCYRRPKIEADPEDRSRPDRWLLDLGPSGALETAVLKLPHPSCRNDRFWSGRRLVNADQLRLTKARELLST